MVYVCIYVCADVGALTPTPYTMGERLTDGGGEAIGWMGSMPV